jgi:hypothetical protein
MQSNWFVHPTIASRNVFFDDKRAKLTDFDPVPPFPATAMSSRETLPLLVCSSLICGDRRRNDTHRLDRTVPAAGRDHPQALPPANANKFAVTLLGLKILPSEGRCTDQNLSGLMSAISTGPMSQWKEILDVLFAPPRRAPFRFEDRLREFEGRVRKFPIFRLSQFALNFGAKYFDASVVGPVTLYVAAIDVMMSGGSLYRRKQSVRCNLEWFVASSGINLLTTFSHLVVCSQSTHGERRSASLTCWHSTSLRKMVTLSGSRSALHL